MQDRNVEMSPLLPATPLDIPNMFTFWEDGRPNHHPEPLQHISLVHSSRDIPLHSDYRPGQIESRLELLQAQLSRWAGPPGHRVGEHPGGLWAITFSCSLGVAAVGSVCTRCS